MYTLNDIKNERPHEILYDIGDEEWVMSIYHHNSRYTVDLYYSGLEYFVPGNFQTVEEAIMGGKLYSLEVLNEASRS